MSEEKKTAEIKVDLSEILDIGGDQFFDVFLDLLVEKAYGLCAPASEIDFEVTGVEGGSMLTFRVAAFLDDEEGKQPWEGLATSRSAGIMLCECHTESGPHDLCCGHEDGRNPDCPTHGDGSGPNAIREPIDR